MKNHFSSIEKVFIFYLAYQFASALAIEAKALTQQ